jgi:2-polyprenyl-3-methyl-5-hydroxy-6-metoxy-1,4-benzoquinol methylase
VDEALRASVSHRSYDPSYFALLSAVEDRHFWFRTRNHVISVLVNQIVANLAPGYRVLDVGCGTGHVLRVVEEACTHGKVIGLDLFAEGLHYAKRYASYLLVQADLFRPPFGTQFDLICLFDVLEHLPDDEQVLRDLSAMLKPGGTLLLTVPAHPSLWSYFDEASHHYRRYTPAELEGCLVDAGFSIDYLTQYMASIFPFVWLGRRVKSAMGLRRADHRNRTHTLAHRELRITPGVNDFLRLLLSLEVRMIARRLRLPVGTALLALARKGSSSTERSSVPPSHNGAKTRVLA